MALGFGVLRLAPAALWSMTPREFAAAAGWVSPDVARPNRDDFSQLMRLFPDMANPDPDTGYLHE
jgi:uncharacterized phage protein (TIGR02216 family)